MPPEEDLDTGKHSTSRPCLDRNEKGWYIQSHACANNCLFGTCSWETIAIRCPSLVNSIIWLFYYSVPCQESLCSGDKLIQQLGVVCNDTRKINGCWWSPLRPLPSIKDALGRLFWLRNRIRMIAWLSKAAADNREFGQPWIRCWRCYKFVLPAFITWRLSRHGGHA